MGWKSVKEHYRVEHTVQVTAKGLCIGSSYIHDIIVVSMDGAILRRYDEGKNADLARYQKEMDADPAKLQELVLAKDHFSADIPVYTYEGGRIIEKHCECLAWPNVTHDGCLMYANTFSPDKEQVVVWAKRNAAAVVALTRERVSELEEKLADFRARLRSSEAEVAMLETDYPGSVISASTNTQAG